MSDPFRPPEQSILRSIGSGLAMLPMAFRILWEASPLYAVLTLAVHVVLATIPAGVIWLTKDIIDGVVSLIGVDPQWSVVFTPLAMLFGLWILQAVIGGLDNIVTEVLSERTYTVASQKLMAKATNLDLAFFEIPQQHDQLHHASNQLWQIQSLGYSTLSLVQSLVSLCLMFGLLAILHPLAIVVLIATVIPRILVEGWHARRRFDLDMEFVRYYRMSDYIIRLLTSKETAREVRTFGLRRYFLNRFAKTRNELINALQRLLIRLFGANVGMSLVSNLGIVSIYCYAVFSAVLGRITIGELTMVAQAAQQCSAGLTVVIRQLGSLYQQSLFMRRYFELVDMDPLTVEGALEAIPAGEIGQVVPSTLKDGITLSDVSFTYPINSEPVLRDLTLKIPAGKKVAIVGVNGAGKTTLIKLLARFYDPTEGSIELDGIPLPAYDLQQLRRSVSVVFQDYARYDLTVQENIGIGRIEEIENKSLTAQSAQAAGADSFIHKLKKGYDTVLGKTFDEGVDLSGGEWQQMAISRAFMSDAPILILDEPTAALDALKEHDLYDEIAQHAADKTVIFISHRFSTVRMADYIAVVDDGQVVEQGTHEDLLDQDGTYAKMFNVQASRYV